jgi:serine/threonine protein kinase
MRLIFLQSLRIKSCRQEDFEIGRIVGTGSFGRVCLARHKSTGTVVAIKSFLKATIVKNQQTDHLISERSVLEVLNHPFIVKMHTTFQEQQCIHFVFEYIAGGEFFSHLRARGQLCEEEARFYAAEVLLVLEYLHSKDIVYRDLKVRSCFASLFPLHLKSHFNPPFPD